MHTERTKKARVVYSPEPPKSSGVRRPPEPPGKVELPAAQKKTATVVTSSESTSSTNVKRRPRKVEQPAEQNKTATVVTSSESTSSTIVKRRPGRPRKVEQPAEQNKTATVVTSSESTSSTNVKRRSRKVEQPAEENKTATAVTPSEPASSANVKRRPGRPRKVPRLPGRPRKVELPAARKKTARVVTSCESTSSTEVKSRHRKVEQPAETATVVTPSEPSSSTEVKGRPGRPRKVEQPAEQNKTSRVDTLPEPPSTVNVKRRPGRPRKLKRRPGLQRKPECKRKKIARVVYSPEPPSISSVKRRPGRPSNVEKPAEQNKTASVVTPSEPASSTEVTRRPGRSSTAEHPTEHMATSADPPNFAGVKRRTRNMKKVKGRPGRPRKVMRRPVARQRKEEAEEKKPASVASSPETLNITEVEHPSEESASVADELTKTASVVASPGTSSSSGDEQQSGELEEPAKATVFMIPIVNQPPENNFAVSQLGPMFEIAELKPQTSYMEFINERQISNGLSCLEIEGADVDGEKFCRNVLVKRTGIQTKTDVVYDRIIGDQAARLAELIMKTIPRAGEYVLDFIYEMSDRRIADYLLDIAKLIGQLVAVYRMGLTIDNGPQFYYVYTKDIAKKTEDIFMRMKLYKVQYVNDAHEFLIRYLPADFLARYVDLVRSLSKRVHGQELVMQLLTLGDDLSMNTCHNWMLEFTLLSFSDPHTELVANSFNDVQLPSVIFLLVHPNVFYGERKQSHTAMFNDLLPSMARSMELKLSCLLEIQSNIPLLSETYTDDIILAIKALTKENPTSNIVVVGWEVSCRLIQQALKYVAGVSAVVLFSYPTLAISADPDDDANLTYCPTLFVCGERGGQDYIAKIRETMDYYIQRTGLVIVNDADVNLHVSTTRLGEERLTQRTIDRAIVKHVYDFLMKNLELTAPRIRALRETMKPVNIEAVMARPPLRLPPLRPAKSTEKAGKPKVVLL